MIEEITRFAFHYKPWDRTSKIRMVTVYIDARNRKEAELINIENSYKFFDLDCTVEVQELFDGYKQMA